MEYSQIMETPRQEPTRRQFIKKTSAATLFVGVGPAFLLTACHSGSYTKTGTPPGGFELVDAWVDNIQTNGGVRTGTLHVKYKNSSSTIYYLLLTGTNSQIACAPNGGTTSEVTNSVELGAAGSTQLWEMDEGSLQGTMQVP